MRTTYVLQVEGMPQEDTRMALDACSFILEQVAYQVARSENNKHNVIKFSKSLIFNFYKIELPVCTKF